MLFTSLRYALFLPAVVAAYFALPQRWRWALILAASYYFYACWRADYLLLIVASTGVDYAAGLGLGAAKSRAIRRAWLGLSLAVNLGLLFAFKYFNFLNDSARAVFDHYNLFYDLPNLDILLPVGISFYTFQTLSYTIDVYWGRREPERHLGRFAAYVAFFPQLVAGPIERSTHLLPQFSERHRPNFAAMADGVSLIFWGLFKKLVIADRLAVFVDEVFNHAGAYEGPPVWLAAYFFSLQIYCDFSAYSDIAIGSAQLMGFQLMDNFRRPYFAVSIPDFWQRWHRSLTTWFRDYLYIPLGGNRVALGRWHFNVLAVFLVSGLWHGANWTFVIWGALHGLYYFVSRWTDGMRERMAHGLLIDRIPKIHQLGRILLTFHLVTFAYIFFRANTVSDAFTLTSTLFAWPGWDAAWRVALRPAEYWGAMLCVAVMFAVEAHWGRQASEHGRAPFADGSPRTRLLFAYAVVMGLLIFARTGGGAFIYFQF